MYNILFEAQAKLNERFQKELAAIIELNKQLVEVLEDHEKDMRKMANEINELKKQLSEKAES